MQMPLKFRLVILISLLLAVFYFAFMSSFTKSGFIRQYANTYPQASPNVITPESYDFLRRLSDAALESTKSHVTYNASYMVIPYPNGDVPINLGVCSDVIIRSYRAVGIDLQREVHEDMKENFLSYPHIWRLLKPDTNIDHRRVPNLMTYFKRQGACLAISDKPDHYLAGDIVAWHLGKGVMHIGVVTHLFSTNMQRPLIVHNIGRGPQSEDALFSWPIIGHYRYKN